jgi:integrase
VRKDEGAADKTRHHESVVIKQLVNWACARGIISDNPLKALRLPKARARPQPCFLLEQVDAVLRAANEPSRSMFAVLAFTGMRVGELQWLSWDDIDFERSVIHVRSKERWSPKSGRDRVVPTHPRVRSVLELLPKGHRWVFTAAPSEKYPEGGRQINAGHLLAKLKAVLRKLGIREGKLHTFRHFFISHCANNGVEPFKLMKWVGHSDLSVILQYYAVSDAESQRAMQRISFAAQPEGEVSKTACTGQIAQVEAISLFSART